MFRSFTLSLFPVTMCLLESTVMGTTGRFEPLILEVNFLVCDPVTRHVWKKAKWVSCMSKFCSLTVAVRNYHAQEGREGISQLLSPVCWYALTAWWWISWKSIYSWVTTLLLTSLDYGLGSYHLTPLRLFLLLLHNYHTPKALEGHTGLSAALLDCEGKGRSLETCQT